MRRIILALALGALTTTLSACAGPTAETQCARAQAELEMCAGAELESPFSASCSGDEASSAESILSQLELSGCRGPAAGKADGFFCGFWDPLGWCHEPPSALGPEPEGDPTYYPILLAHGFNTSTTNFWRFHDVDVALENDGHTVALGSVPPFDTPMARAEVLAGQVDALLARSGADMVNLVCFSQGGVDCRYLVSPDGLGYGDRVASVTTLSSPHRGTNLADVAVAALPSPDSAGGDLVDAVASLYGATFSELAGDSHFVAAMESMSEAEMVRFNETYGDDPGVYYQSWAGFSYVGGLRNPRDTLEDVCRDDDGVLRVMWHEGKRDVMDPLLVPGAALVAHGIQLRPNDGVSMVESAIWGRFRGCIPADHLDQVGQINDRGVDRRTGFAYLRFYRNIAFELAAMGY